MNRCLKRLIGLSTSVSFKTTHYINTSVCNKNTNTTVLPRNAAFATSFVSQASSSQGLGNEVSIDIKSLHQQSDQEKGRCDRNIDILASEAEKQFRIIEKGDVVNLSDLLFTENRDYLIRYGDPRLVTADELAGKVVLICFVKDDPYSLSSRSNTFIPSLIDVYNDLKHKNCFEVVFVFLGDAFARRDLVIPFKVSLRKSQCKSQTPFSQSEARSEPQIFEDIFSHMPWTAIPFSDITLRKNLGKKFGIKDYSDYAGFVIDSTGKVLQTHCCQRVIDKYGSPAYPFSDERIAFIDSEDKIIAKQPSLNSLLVSPQRDYVISNKGEKVPMNTLEDKVVALYFFEDDNSHYNPTKELITAYEELAKSNGNFEVVLIYLSDLHNTYKYTNEETFRNTFSSMPWLALPFKDPIHKRLKRLFRYPPLDGQTPPDFRSRREKAPSLVIYGPHGEFIEPCGAELLLQYGVSAYPFTRENLVKLETENVKELTLEMLCSPTTVFRRNYGSQVQSSYFVGKRVIFYFESSYWDHFYDPVTFKDKVRFVNILKEVEFLTMLKERYLRMKGTNQEFEVIYIPSYYFYDEFCFSELVADLPWFVSPRIEWERGPNSVYFTYYGISYPTYKWPFLLAFGEDGRLVRRTICPKVMHDDFPSMLVVWKKRHIIN